MMIIKNNQKKTKNWFENGHCIKLIIVCLLLLFWHCFIVFHFFQFIFQLIVFYSAICCSIFLFLLIASFSFFNFSCCFLFLNFLSFYFSFSSFKFLFVKFFVFLSVSLSSPSALSSWKKTTSVQISITSPVFAICHVESFVCFSICGCHSFL